MTLVIIYIGDPEPLVLDMVESVRLVKHGVIETKTFGNTSVLHRNVDNISVAYVNPRLDSVDRAEIALGVE